MPQEARSAAPVPGKKTWDDMSFMEKMTFVRRLLEHVALALVVLVRCRPGFRTLEINRLLAVCGAMIVISYFAELNPAAHYEATPLGGLLVALHLPLPPALVLYSFAVLGVGLWKRHKRWQALKAGERWHSRSLGVAYITNLPIWNKLPAKWLDENRLQRVFEPAVYYVIGLLITGLLSPALGVWTMMSAIALLMLEATQYEAAVNTTLNSLDGLIESEIHEENVKHFSGGRTDNMLDPTVRPKSLMDTAGIPTGIGLDIAAQVEKRRLRDAQKMAEQAHQNGRVETVTAESREPSKSSTVSENRQ